MIFILCEIMRGPYYYNFIIILSTIKILKFRKTFFVIKVIVPSNHDDQDIQIMLSHNVYKLLETPPFYKTLKLD
jgi:hypothetical protein